MIARDNGQPSRISINKLNSQIRHQLAARCRCSLRENVVQVPPTIPEGHARSNGDYFQRFFFVRTLNLTIGRLALEEMRALLRRRRRSHRASSEKKCRAIQRPAMTAPPPIIASTMGSLRFMGNYLSDVMLM